MATRTAIPGMLAWSQHRERLSQLDGEAAAGRPLGGLDRGRQNPAPAGYFKIRMRRFRRWFICATLPDTLIYDEWLFFDKSGQPAMYWHHQRQGVVLLGL